MGTLCVVVEIQIIPIVIVQARSTYIIALDLQIMVLVYGIFTLVAS